MRWVLIILFLSLPPYAHAEGRLPRFASLGSNEANLRAGPGTRYPIRWVYHRKGMPVEIIDEYGNWRQIRDVDGAEGWLHYGLLSGRRSALVRGHEQLLRRNPDAESPTVLIAKPMVIGHLLRCSLSWCYLEIQGYKGWMEKSAFFGAYKEEKF